MARPLKQGIDYFPLWMPQQHTLSKFGYLDSKVAYKALRNSSSGFIKRADVREFILKRDNYKCKQCGATDNLQIDHIHSVWSALKDKSIIQVLNTSSNLQTLCVKCNAAKLP